MKRTLLAFCSFFAGLSLFSQNIAPSHLRTSLLEFTARVWEAGHAPFNTTLEQAVLQKEKYQFAVISDPQPFLQWRSPAITAFRLQLASSLDLLKQGKPDYWDSKKKQSITAQTVYAGRPLQPRKIYYWQVQVWNKAGKSSSFSEPTAFYFDPSDSDAHYPLEAIEQECSVTETHDRYFADFRVAGFSKLKLEIEATKEDSIDVEVGELANSDYSINKNYGRNIRYTSIRIAVAPGTIDYPIIWPPDEKRNSRNAIQMPDCIGEVYPFRYVSVKLKPGIHIKRISRRMVSYPFDYNAARFRCSDPVLEKVWKLCQYSMHATSFCGYYVDGDRERLPYEADALINQLSHYAVDAEYSIGRRTMSYLLYHPTWPTEWSLQNVLLAWNDYMYTGDKSFIEKNYGELKLKMLMPLAGEHGLISTRTGLQTNEFLDALHKKDFDGRHGLQDIVDWPQTGALGSAKEYPGETDGFVFNRYNAVVNAFYYRNLVLMEKIASALGKKEDVGMFASKAKEVYDGYQLVFTDAKTGLVKDGDSTTHSALHSNMFALDYGLVSPEHVPAVLAHIQSRKMACSVYGSQFLLESLFDHGADNYAISLMSDTSLRSWYNMIRIGSSITMEAWDIAYKANLDLNHAWGAAPANIIIRKMMGIEPLSPGFERFRVQPQLGKLKNAFCETPTIKGSIRLSYEQIKSEDSWQLTVPFGSEAVFYLPIHGKTKALKNGQPIVGARKENGYWIIDKLSAGDYKFTCK